MQWNVLLALCVIGCKAGSKRWCGGRWLPLRGSSAAHTSLNFLSIKVDVRRVSGSSPLSALCSLLKARHRKSIQRFVVGIYAFGSIHYLTSCIFPTIRESFPPHICIDPMLCFRQNYTLHLTWWWGSCKPSESFFYVDVAPDECVCRAKISPYKRLKRNSADSVTAIVQPHNV